jgi:hypothetical protein
MKLASIRWLVLLHIVGCAETRLDNDIIGGEPNVHVALRSRHWTRNSSPAAMSNAGCLGHQHRRRSAVAIVDFYEIITSLCAERCESESDNLQYRVCFCSLNCSQSSIFANIKLRGSTLKTLCDHSLRCETAHGVELGRAV